MSSSPLRRALAGALPQRPFELCFWDGRTLPATAAGADGAVRFQLRSPQALAHLLRSPSRLGLGRAYVDGSLDTDDLDGAFAVIDSFGAPPIGHLQRARLLLALLSSAVGGGIPQRPAIELLLGGERHSLERDAEAVRYHYDVGNEFFELFLDESMTYSCALFRDGAQTLEQAQRAKLDLVARKLDLQPGQRLLDVGCGWGSFAMHAAEHYGVQVLGITLSEAQAERAAERVQQAGLQSRVQIRLVDYRRLAEQPFDAISSIGMVEHVGEARIDEYAQILASMLKPGGRLLNHGIAAIRNDFDADNDPFTNRYVFPDGELLFCSRIQAAVEHAGLVSEHIEAFAEDYAITLQHWADRLDQHLDRAIALAGEQRSRVWRLYLRAARAGFTDGYTAVYQILARKPPER